MREDSFRLADATSDRFSIVSMHEGRSADFGDQINRLSDVSFDDTTRVIVDGSPQFIFRCMLLLDGCVSRLLLAPRIVSSSISNAMKSQADIALVEHPRLVERWKGLPTVIGGTMLCEASQKGLCKRSRNLVGATQQNTQWVLATSGTTGDCKLVGHHFRSIARTARAGERYRGLRWGLVFDVARFAGLQVLVQALVSGSVLLSVDLDDSVQNQVAWLVEQKCDALSATPTRWRQMLMTDRLRDLPLRQVTIGGEIADERLLWSLRDRFPHARISHIYASTEGGVAFSVHDGKPGFPRSFLETAGGSVRLAIDCEGMLWVCGPCFESLNSICEEHYDLGCESTLNEHQGVNGTDWLRVHSTRGSLANEEPHPQHLPPLGPGLRWINTGDKVEVTGDRVIFLGRADGAINVGGSKVFPERIESIVRQVKGVESVFVRGKPSSVAGYLVEAFVTINHDMHNERSMVEMIRAHCRASLAKHEIPAFIHIVDELPVTESGKISRAAFR